MYLVMKVMEGTDFKSGVRFDLHGYPEAAVASGAKKSPLAISLNVCRRSITSVPCFPSADVPASTVLLNFGVFGCAVSVAAGLALSAPCIPDCGTDRYLTVGIAASSVLAQVCFKVLQEVHRHPHLHLFRC